MRMFVLFILITLIVACSSQTMETSLEPGNHHFTLKHDGLERNYDVYIPPNPTEGMPILFALHGGGGNIERMRSYSGLDATAAVNGFIVVYPQGSTSPLAPKIGSWNAGDCCGRAKKKNIDDVGFLSQVIDKVIQEFKGDETKVYITGMSNGAQMSYRLACERPEKLAGIAPVGGNSVLQSCAPSEPVPVIHFHGEQDLCQPLTGSDSCGGCFDEYIEKTLGFSFGEDEYSCEPIQETIQRWRTVNHAASTPELSFETADTKCYLYDSDAPVSLCVSASGGHTWPGMSEENYCTENINCELYKEIVGSVAPVDWNNIMWAFFENYS